MLVCQKHMTFLLFSSISPKLENMQQNKKAYKALVAPSLLNNSLSQIVDKICFPLSINQGTCTLPHDFQYLNF